ncbi:DUF488 domain-containing protein [Nitratireductor sp. GCM10026969]|uniref:DUF488 domain-containing protein n=1 Tax=Nitratireductor sp. GCM10026969 TaxID=3252645 RepID=UPI00360CA1C7
MRQIKIKRLYDAPAPEDGFRVLVDRLWPRGIAKEKAEIHHWAKEAAPSTELRKWFHHDPERWSEFERRYRAELATQTDLLREIVALGGDRPLTLLYSAKDRTHNQAVVLKDVLERI